MMNLLLWIIYGWLIIFSPNPYNFQNQKLMELTISSKAFQQGDRIPLEYTCDGQNISPQLQWSAGPEGTLSYAIISDDPDAPMGTWVHWVVYNIPAKERSIMKNQPKDPVLPNGAVQGITDFRSVGYGGPCPPSGIHRYFFHVYALDVILDTREALTKSQLLHQMQGHILAQGSLMGLYSR